MSGRKWPDVVDAWNEMAPTEKIGVPTEPIGEGLSILLGAPLEQERWETDDQKDEVRILLLREGLYLVHKAAHVLGAALAHVDGGMASWSNSSGYQSALFGVRGLLSFVGVTVFEWNNQKFLLDAWKGGASEAPLRFERLRATKHEHLNLWVLFSRVLRVVEAPEEVWPRKIVQELCGLGESEFASQRNRLLYMIHSWPLDDLHELVYRPAFGVYRCQEHSLEASRIDFSVVLAGAILRCVLGAISSLAGRVPRIGSELQKLENWFAAAEFGTRYRASRWQHDEFNE